jgi:hypothetical protein
MFEQKRFMAPEVGEGGGGGGGSAVLEDQAPAAPAVPPAAPEAQVTPAAPGNDSLLSKPPASATVPPADSAAAPAGSPAWLTKVPEKFHVKTADGNYDAEATLAKQAESYTHLEKHRGPQPPATASDYKFAAPEAFKDIKLDDALSASFRERAHKAGMSQEQYQMAVEAHLEMMPSVLDATLKLAADECRSELQKVWKAPQEFEAGLADAQRAVNGAPEAIREDIWARFGRDPAFIQFAASLGKEMREDKPGNPGQTATGAPDQSGVEALMASEAYRNPKHADHAATTARVQAFWKRAYGDNPAN